MFKLPIAMPAKARLRMVAAILLGFAAGQVHAAETSSPVVRAVLFASPTCSHCAKVREEVLPPLAARYGSQLKIVIVSTVTPTGNELFLSACMQHGLQRLSVPLLIVGNKALVGSDEIPLKFPDLIEKHLAAGGIDWPGIPGLSTILAANPTLTPNAPQHAEPPAAEPTTVASTTDVADAKPQAKHSPAQTTTAVARKSSVPPARAASPSLQQLPTPNSWTSESTGSGVVHRNSAASSIIPPSADEATVARATPPTSTVKAKPSGIIDLTGGEAEAGVVERIKRDIYGNGLAILVLTGMVLTLLVSPGILKKSAIPVNAEARPRHDWLIPILTLAGLGVAAYLSHVELRQVEAVCGPVGDCNTVNQSEYAKLFGILPIGVLGLLGFLAILAAWTLRRWGSGRISHWAAAGMLGITGFGILFSIYLTFLEPFVIGATCLWCLSSAVIMTTLYVLALKPGRRAWSALK